MALAEVMSVHAQANGDDGKGQNSKGQTAAEKQEARILVLEEKLGNFARLVERLEARIRQQESQPERPASTAPVVEVDGRCRCTTASLICMRLRSQAGLNLWVIGSKIGFGLC